MIRAALYLAIVLASNTACAAAKKHVAIDIETASSVVDGDATGLVEGCGNQPIVGFTYCRVSEGDTSEQKIFFIGPPAKCNKADACTFVKVWNNQGVLVWGGAIPNADTRVGVPWRVLLSSSTFELSQRGFWTYNVQVFWIDPDGKERNSVAQGDIVLRVFRKGYTPLHNVEEDPNFVWSWTDNGFLYKMTSGLRAFVKRIN